MSKAHRTPKSQTGMARKTEIEANSEQEEFDFVFRTAECKDNDGTFYNGHDKANENGQFVWREGDVKPEVEQMDDWNSGGSGIGSETNKSNSEIDFYIKIEPEIQIDADEQTAGVDQIPKKFVKNGNRQNQKRELFKCDICEKCFQSRCHLNRHKNIHSPGKKFECEICQKLFTRADNLKTHQKNLHKETSMKCAFCDKKFTDKNVLRQHVRKDHYKSCRPQRRVVNKLSKKIANNSGSKKINFKRHKIYEAEKKVGPKEREFQCGKCPKKFSRSWNRLQHERSHSSSFKCNNCEKSFNYMTNLIRHKRLQLSDQCQLAQKYHECEICRVKFNRKYDLKRHEQSIIHRENERLNKISNAIGRNTSKTDQTKSGDGPETNIDSKERRFRCSMCPKRFQNNWKLKRHERSHMNIRPFECDICKETFTENSHLKRHRMIHFPRKYFECQICDKKYTRIENLRHHNRNCHEDTEIESLHNAPSAPGGQNNVEAEMIESNVQKDEIIEQEKKSELKSSADSKERTFQCGKCPEKFSSNGHRLRHELTHINMMPFNCDICEKTFILKSDFITHKRTHQGKKATRRPVIEYDMYLDDIEL